jgi:thiamine biosynthesis lipoprotein ApbE
LNVLGGVAALLLAAGCSRGKIERVEWPVMGTIAAVQCRADSGARWPMVDVPFVKKVFSAVEKLMNAHDHDSELSRLAPLGEEEILANCNRGVRPCYEAAFKLMRESGGAFNPRWKGPKTLDLGAIAKGYAVSLVTNDFAFVSQADMLVDLGGNVKSVRGTWKTGVRNPSGDGFAAVVDLREGEALATSATYYRGSHIYDGRTGMPVSNGVASVTVLCNSAMWADGLSTTLFVLGPEEGKKFLDDKLKLLVGDMEVSALWIMADGREMKVDADNRFLTNLR